MDKRIHWVDIAKGLLILMVVWGHINYVSVLVLGKACFVDVERTTSLYFPWYMAVFFCITGYCTNYRKPFLKFFKEKFKSLIIPNVLLGSMLFVPQSIMLGQPLESVIAGCIRNIFLYGGSYWFLTALFIADIIFYWILRLTDKRLLQLMILGILYLIGTVSFVYHVPNLMNFENAFALTGCLFLGMFFKQNNKFISDKRWALAIGGRQSL
jgi:fucose 4-O-acetylase-like acetyltransferase